MDQPDLLKAIGSLCYRSGMVRKMTRRAKHQYMMVENRWRDKPSFGEKVRFMPKDGRN